MLTTESLAFGSGHFEIEIAARKREKM